MGPDTAFLAAVAVGGHFACDAAAAVDVAGQNTNETPVAAAEGGLVGVADVVEECVGDLAARTEVGRFGSPGAEAVARCAAAAKA